MKLSGLELRKAACGALGYSAQRFELTGLKGWALVDVNNNRMRNTTVGDDYPNAEREVWTFAPAIESDPAVSEPLFLEWCEKNGYGWRIHSATDHLIGWIVGRGGEQLIRAVTGITPSEVRALIIVEASRKGAL